MAKDINNKVLELQVNLNKVLIELNKMTQEGGNSVESYEKLRQKFEQLLSAAKGVEGSINRSYGQTKNIELYKKRLQDLVTALNKIKTANNKIDSEVKSQLKEQAELREKNLKKEQRLLRSSIKEGNARRTADLKEFEARQKAFRDKRLAREKQIEREKTAQFKKEEKERTRIANQEARKRDKEAQQKDFRGGFGAQLTPRAIGGALGSLTKYLGLYQAINAAQRVFRELTLGSVREAIAFEKALANLGAVAGATSEDVSMLGKNALSVAGATKFTAEEIVGLQTELSKLGFTAEDVVASTEAIAFTAQALGSPLAATAEQVGKVINQFDLLIEQAEFVGDVLVTTINNSALSFDSFGTAIQYVGPIARNLGLSLEQTAGAMAVLADNGFTASRIGTGLRGIFTELGKTSADVEKSLKDLAEQNISLSEAVDLVGKRNAAQLITLLNNIDAIDEGNNKYYQQGRALESAAKQADSFSGQMDILTSNFREFQIELGRSVVESNLLIGVLDILFEKGARTARGFKLINEIGFQDLSDSVDEIVNGADLTNTTLEILGSNINQLEKAQENLQNRTSGFWKQFFIGTRQSQEEFGESQESSEELLNSYNALFDVLKRLSDERIKNASIVEGQKKVDDEYKETVDALVDTARDGVNVNKEANEVYRDIQSDVKIYEDSIKNLNSEIEENNKFLKDNKDLDELTKIAIEEKIKELKNEVAGYEGSIKTLKGYEEQINNVIISKKRLQEIAEEERNKALKLERDNIKERIKNINEENKIIIDSINERAKQQTAIAEGTAEEADIEAKRQAAVADAYRETAKTIAGINFVYEENKSIVDEAVKSNEKLAEVLGSEVINDLNNAFKGYSSELSELKKALDDGTINQENYDDAVIVLRNNLIKTIDTFKAFAGTSPELNEFFDNLLLNFDVLIAEANAVDDAMRETFGEAIKTELIDSLDDALNTAAEAISKFNDVALENTKNRLESEKSEIKNRYDIEQQILESQLNNQLITESQFRAKQKELQKAKIAEENNIDKQIFQAEQKQDKQDATTDYLKAIASIIPTLIAYDKTADPVSVLAKAAVTGALATASYGAELSAIGQRKFFPKKFAKGGVVKGPSHAQGGVPFSVQGRNGYEMEGGEYIINRESTMKYKGLLDLINGTPRPTNYNVPVKFAEGGMVTNNITNNFTNESVDYLKAIAEATVSTAIGVSKPVRAYVADKDLRTNNTERRIRDRNDRI